MIGIKRSLITLAIGAAFALSGSVGAFAAQAGSPAISMAPSGAAADHGIMLVKKHWKGGGGNYGGGKYGGGNYGGKHGGKHYGNYRRNRGYNNFLFAAPFLAAPFIYNDYYGDYGYSSYSYGYGGGNSCYRECRYEHGPRYCRYNWEDYC